MENQTDFNNPLDPISKKSNKAKFIAIGILSVLIIAGGVYFFRDSFGLQGFIRRGGETETVRTEEFDQQDFTRPELEVSGEYSNRGFNNGTEAETGTGTGATTIYCYALNAQATVEQCAKATEEKAEADAKAKAEADAKAEAEAEADAEAEEQAKREAEAAEAEKQNKIEAEAKAKECKELSAKEAQILTKFNEAKAVYTAIKEKLEATEALIQAKADYEAQLNELEKSNADLEVGESIISIEEYEAKKKVIESKYQSMLKDIDPNIDSDAVVKYKKAEENYLDTWSEYNNAKYATEVSCK